MVISAIVDGVIRVASAAVHPKAMEHVWRRLTFPNPAYSRALRMGRAPFGIPEEISLLEVADDGRLQLPRGAVGVLRQALATAGQHVRFEDRRVLLPVIDLALQIPPRDYQARAAAALVEHVQGYAVAPCGGGKSVLALAAAAAIRQPTLVLVRSKDLVAQWCEAAGGVLGASAGVIADGRHAPGAVTVATTQALAAMGDAALGDLGQRFGCVIVDEAHSVAAPTDRRVLGHLPARFRFGLTATPERADGLGSLLDLVIGPAVHRIEHRELVEAGHLVVPRVEPVHTGCAPAAETHGELVAALVADDRRNGRIVELVRREVRAGHTVLVLSGRVEHCQRLATLLRAEGVLAEALTGEAARGRRADLLGRFRGGALEVLCATSLADEGLDVPRLDRLVLATPARAEGRTIQRLGRLMRPFEGKGQPVLFDLVDEGRIARAQYRARAAAYRTVLGATPSAAAPRGTETAPW
jgi:superfamily II DNA or RNA helicase